MKFQKFNVSLLGLFLSFYLTASAMAGISVELANAPSTDLALTLKAIGSAKKKLKINIYEFTSSEIADAVIEKVAAGLEVEILAENQPVGGLSKEGKAIQKRVVDAMNEAGGDHYYVMTSKLMAKRRFRFNHAKYILADDATLLIGSENYSPSGNPVPGKKGNRGWEVLIHDSEINGEYAGTFAEDTNLRFGDVSDLVSDAKAKAAAPAQTAQVEVAAGVDATSVEKITSPETSEGGLVALLNSAQSSIDIQQMTFSSDWKQGSSPLFDAVVAAARRGVSVRVLLNDETVFDHSLDPAKSKNLPTIKALNELSRRGLKVAARTADLKAMGVDYIHNKGLLVDGNKTLISSINWDENSVTNNRESAVVITSPAVFQYFSALFEKDWAASEPNLVQ